MRHDTNCEDRAGKTCGDCEYFDRFNGDCLNRLSPRFQTTGADEACSAFCLDATHVRQLAT
jgi:hypothetical protein